MFRHFFIKRLRQKRHFSNMFPTKCQGQNDRMRSMIISCFRQHLDFSIGFATNISIFKLRLLFRFLCLINSFYRRCVSCVYIIYPVYPIYPIYPIYPVYPIYPIYCLTISYYFLLFRAIVRCCVLLCAISFSFCLLRTISAKFGTTERSPWNTYNTAIVYR